MHTYRPCHDLTDKETHGHLLPVKQIVVLTALEFDDCYYSGNQELGYLQMRTGK